MKTIDKIIQKYKEDYCYSHMIEDNDLTLHGFTTINMIDGIAIATRSFSSGEKFCYYRILSPVHYHHIEKINRIREALNKDEYKYKMYTDKRTERVKSWFRKMHNEIYFRDREL